MHDIGRRLGVSGASVVQLVDDLEARGLVERRRLELDRRTQLVHLLPGATEALAEARERAVRTIAQRMGNLDPGQVRRLVVLLQRFVTGE